MILEQLEAYVNHQQEVRAAVRQSHPPPPMPGQDVVGNAAILMRKVAVGKSEMKGTEEAAIRLRKRLYAGNTLYGSHDIWATISPNDMNDGVVAAYAGYKFVSAGGHRADETSHPDWLTPPKERCQDDMSMAVAKNPVACAIAFRDQVEIYVKHIIGWDLKTGRSEEGIMSLVQAFSLQVCTREINVTELLLSCDSLYHSDIGLLLMKDSKITYIMKDSKIDDAMCHTRHSQSMK